MLQPCLERGRLLLTKERVFASYYPIASSPWAAGKRFTLSLPWGLLAALPLNSPAFPPSLLEMHLVRGKHVFSLFPLSDLSRLDYSCKVFSFLPFSVQPMCLWSGISPL